MSVDRSTLVSILSINIPQDVVERLIDEYVHIKQQFFQKKYLPSELNGAKFAECLVRAIQYLNEGSCKPLSEGYRPGDIDRILNSAGNNTLLPDCVRFYFKGLVRVMLDIRNKRDVAHVGGKVSPNYSDSLLLVECADWILIELVREYAVCPIDQARKIVDSINQVKIPIIADVDGFLRIQSKDMQTKDKVLIFLYYKKPDALSETQLRNWCEYENTTRFRESIIKPLHKAALLHYTNGKITLLPFGVAYVEKNISVELTI